MLISCQRLYFELIVAHFVLDLAHLLLGNCFDEFAYISAYISAYSNANNIKTNEFAYISAYSNANNIETNYT